MPPFLPHLSSSIFIATFKDIIAVLLYSLYFVLSLRWLHYFFLKFRSVIVSNAKADKLRIGSAFAAVGFCKFKTSNPRFKTLISHHVSELVRYDSSADSNLRESLERSLNVWLLRIANACERRLKISPMWVTAAIWFFGGRVVRYRTEKISRKSCAV